MNKTNITLKTQTIKINIGFNKSFTAKVIAIYISCRAFKTVDNMGIMPLLLQHSLIIILLIVE